MMETMTTTELVDMLKAQGVSSSAEAKFICPNCKTAQSANDLIAAGAGATFDDVQGSLAFSCVGRFDADKGCDWTLGGLFRIHELEIIDDGEKPRPCFLPANHPALTAVKS